MRKETGKGRRRAVWTALLLGGCLLAGCAQKDQGPSMPIAQSIGAGQEGSGQENGKGPEGETALGQADQVQENVEGPEGETAPGQTQGNGKSPEGETAPGQTDEGTPDSSDLAQQTQQDQEQEAPEQTAAPGEFSFADLEGWEFYFSSGAGGWYEVLHVHGDGSFDGHFQDADMGDLDPERYPSGTLYCSDYTGTFTQPRKVDDFTYQFQVQSIEYSEEFGERIEDGTRVIYTDAYGMGDAQDLYLYLPGSLLQNLPQEYLNWTDRYVLEKTGGVELPYYGLYNEKPQNGFTSDWYGDEGQDAEGSLSALLDDAAARAQQQADELEQKIQEADNQLDLSLLSDELYKVWDGALNEIWGILRENLDGETMEGLTQEEREWIARKEEAVQKAGKEYEAGTMQPMVTNLEAAEQTRLRVYELTERY